MDWHNLINENQLDELVVKSQERPQLIYKHSTRCGTSSLIRNRLERATVPAAMDFYPIKLRTALEYGTNLHRYCSFKMGNVYIIKVMAPFIWKKLRNKACVPDAGEVKHSALSDQLSA